MMKIKAMLLAAGLGTRFYPYTKHVAKPAIPFLDIPLMGYPLSLLESLRFSDLVVNSHYRPDDVKRVVESLCHEQTYRTHISHENEILGSGGALWGAREHLADCDVLVVANGDEVLLPPHGLGLKPALEWHLRSKSWATLVTTHHKDVGSIYGGVWCDEDLQVYGFGKSCPTSAQEYWKAHKGKVSSGEKEICLRPLHYTGVVLLSPEVLRCIPEGSSNILYDILTKGILSGKKVSAFYEKDLLWFETGNVDSYLKSTKDVLSLFGDQNVISVLAQPKDTEDLFKVGINFQKQNPVSRNKEHYLENMKSIFKRYRPNFQWSSFQVRDTSSRCKSDVPEGVHFLLGAKAIVEDDVKMKGFVVVGSHVHIKSGTHLENEVHLNQSLRVPDLNP